MYKVVSHSSEPSIIGVNNGVYQVELNDKKSFLNKEEKRYYESYFNDSVDSFILENFKKNDSRKITELLYFPLKKAKETDFVCFSPFELGLDFIVSQKALNIIEQFALPDYIKIPAKINGFKNDYYTIGFPIVTNDRINFPKSKFYHRIKKIELDNLSFEDYKKVSGALVKTLTLELVNTNYKKDILNLQGQGLFFSNPLISKLQENNIIGLEIGNTTLEMP
ncbi:MAG: hypothetical protein ACSHWV_11035 [Cellulophaga fucicola]